MSKSLYFLPALIFSVAGCVSSVDYKNKSAKEVVEFFDGKEISAFDFGSDTYDPHFALQGFKYELRSILKKCEQQGGGLIIKERTAYIFKHKGNKYIDRKLTLPSNMECQRNGAPSLWAVQMSLDNRGYVGVKDRTFYGILETHFIDAPALERFRQWDMEYKEKAEIRKKELFEKKAMQMHECNEVREKEFKKFLENPFVGITVMHRHTPALVVDIRSPLVFLQYEKTIISGDIQPAWVPINQVDWLRCR